MKVLDEKFYARHAEIVAKELLGKILTRSLGSDLLAGKIVETESYHGIRDPASRAFGGKKNNISKYMWNKPGTAFVYMVHGNWMFNVITGKENEPSGVLFRAIEPLQGIDKMFELRKKINANINDVEQLCSGPGKLTQAFNISPILQEKTMTQQSDIYVLNSYEKVKITKAYRIGVTKDTKRKQRFYISENVFVSKK
ncbi:MAG: DNA-3-methyladenine glycosylase [Nanoarchaeota archaeon]